MRAPASAFFLGLRTRGGDLLPAGRAEMAIGDYLWRSFRSGCTFWDTRGLYRGVPEPGLFIYVSGIGAEEERTFLDWMLRTFDQIQVGKVSFPELLLYPELTPAELTPAELTQPPIAVAS